MSEESDGVQRNFLIAGLMLACLGCSPTTPDTDDAAADNATVAPAASGDSTLPRAGLYRMSQSATWLTGGGEIVPPGDEGDICVPALTRSSFASWAAGNIVPRCPSDVSLGNSSFDARAACTDPEYGDIDVTSHASFGPDSIDVESDLYDGTDTMRISTSYRRTGDC